MSWQQVLTGHPSWSMPAPARQSPHPHAPSGLLLGSALHSLAHASCCALGRPRIVANEGQLHVMLLESHMQVSRMS